MGFSTEFFVIQIVIQVILMYICLEIVYGIIRRKREEE